MKKLSFLSLLLFAALTVSAQKPTAGMKSFTFGFNGLQNIGLNTNTSHTGTLLFRKYTSETMALRGSANLTFNNLNSSLEDNAGGTITTTKSSGMGIGIGIGIQKSLTSSNRLEPYVGIDLTLGTSFGSNNSRFEVVENDSTINPFDSTGDFTEVVNKQGAGINAGIFPLIGVNYYLLDNLAIGAEFSYGIMFNTVGQGQQTTNSKVSGSDKPESIVDTTPKNTNFNIGTGGTSLITISVFF